VQNNHGKDRKIVNNKKDSKNITKRIVITNKVNSIQTLENINIQLISLEEFLVNGFY